MFSLIAEILKSVLRDEAKEGKLNQSHAFLNEEISSMNASERTNASATPEPRFWSKAFERLDEIINGPARDVPNLIILGLFLSIYLVMVNVL